MTRAHQAASAINAVHVTLPPDISLADRIKAIDAAYPFGARAFSPYKVWLKERRAYLCKYGYQARNAPPESPLERMMRRSA